MKPTWHRFALRKLAFVFEAMIVKAKANGKGVYSVYIWVGLQCIYLRWFTVYISEVVPQACLQCVTNIEFTNEYEYIRDIKFLTDTSKNIFVLSVLVEYKYWKYSNIRLKSSKIRIFLKSNKSKEHHFTL